MKQSIKVKYRKISRKISTKVKSRKMSRKMSRKVRSRKMSRKMSRKVKSRKMSRKAKMMVFPFDHNMQNKISSYLNLDSKASLASTHKEGKRMSGLYGNNPVAWEDQSINLENISQEKLYNFFEMIKPAYGVTLNISNCNNIIDLRGIEELTKLKSLNISNCSQPLDISSIRNLTKLESLSISESNIINNNISFVSELKNLKNINLYKLNIYNIPNLDLLEKLESLSISYCYKIDRIPSMNNLKNIKSLTIDHSGHIDGYLNMPNLEYLKDLDFLNLSYLIIRPEDISSVSNLTNLKNLNLSGLSNFSDISFLNRMEKLESLTLYQCGNLRRLPSMSNLSRLKELNLGLNGGITNIIEAISDLRNLEILDVNRCFNKISNIEILRNFSKLKYLDISYTDVYNIEPISNLTNLKYLDISGLKLFSRNLKNITKENIRVLLINNPDLKIKYK